MAIPPRTRGALEARGQRSFLVRRIALPAQAFVHAETTGGIALLAAALLALVWANSPWAQSYLEFWHTEISLDLAILRLSADLQHWVNDGLMVLFFFVIGLEIKREFLQGELSSRQQALLPAMAAAGGMVVPAAIFAFFNAGTPALRGWAIPVATDIAFALGVLALAGARVPPAVRVFLLGIAVADDIGGIAIIALFYTSELDLPALGVAGLCVLTIWGLLRLGVRGTVVYLFLAIALWLAVYRSGIHATIAGVMLAALVPASPYYRRADLEPVGDDLLNQFRRARERGAEVEAEALMGQMEELIRGTESSLARLQRLVHPWSSYLVVPLFALANAGVVIDPAAIQAAVSSPVSAGVFLGLVAGKPAGVTAASWVAVKLGWSRLPTGATWSHVAAVGLLAGIGFTVAIFIATLAFDGGEPLAQSKIAILCASIFAGVMGYVTIRWLTASQS